MKIFQVIFVIPCSIIYYCYRKNHVFWDGYYSKWPNGSHFGVSLQHIGYYSFSSTLAKLSALVEAYVLMSASSLCLQSSGSEWRQEDTETIQQTLWHKKSCRKCLVINDGLLDCRHTKWNTPLSTICCLTTMFRSNFVLSCFATYWM